jgi:hypothetical protein
MPISTRGRLRDVVKCVPVSDSLKYSFKTSDLSGIAGVSAGDITALGQENVTGQTGLIVFSPRSPKPAQFRKRLAAGGPQGSVTAYGNGLTASAINNAAGAGWQQTRGIRGTRFGNTTRSAAIAITVSNGLLVKFMRPIADLSFASELGWDTTISAANAKKLVFAPQGAKVALVKKVVGETTITQPVSASKYESAQASGWQPVRSEMGFAAVAPATPE